MRICISCQSALQLHLQLEALKAADLLEAGRNVKNFLAFFEIPWASGRHKG